MKCDKSGCRNTAISYQRYSGLHFCGEHLVKDVERKVKREMRKELMVERGDRVAVALSGGKDSSSLLYILKKIFHSRPELEFFAISVDEGIKNYRDITIKNAERITKELGVKLLYFSFKDEFGFTVDEIASMNFTKGVCSFCGVLRRKIIEEKAKEFGATKVATGHNLDDEVQTILMNYIRGDVERLGRLRLQGKEEFIRRIKPLREVPEKENTLYGIIEDIIPVNYQYQCPYAEYSFRFSVRKVLNEFEKKCPSAKYSLMRGYEKMLKLKAFPRNHITLLKCEKCGGASSSKICKACEMVGKVKCSGQNQRL